MHEPSVQGVDGVPRVDRRAAVVLALLFVVLVVVTPLTAWRRLIAYGAVLLIIQFSARIPARAVLQRFTLALPFLVILLVAVPFMAAPAEHGGSLSGWQRVVTIGAGALLCIWMMALLTVLLGAQQLLEALVDLRMPRLMVTLAAFTLRYLDVFVDEAARLRRARASRGGAGVGFRRSTHIIGCMVGAMFVRAFERADRIGKAMAARGFTGTLPRLHTGEGRPRDWLWAGPAAAALVFLIVRDLLR